MIKIKIYKFRIDFNEYQKRININNTNVRSRRSEFRLVEDENPEKQEKETVRFLRMKQNNFNYLVLSFVLNNLILDNALKYYEYKVTCNVSGYVYTETGGVEAKSEEEALELFKEKYKFWNENCKFQEVSKSSDK